MLHFSTDLRLVDWVDRTEKVSKLVLSLSPTSVHDFGCGLCSLRQFLPVGVSYTGYDAVRYLQAPDVQVFDFNDTLPSISAPVGGVGVAIGLLEYLDDLPGFLDYMLRTFREVVLTYVAASENAVGESLERRKAGWVTHLTRADLLRLVYELGASVVEETRWHRQIILVLRSSAQR